MTESVRTTTCNKELRNYELFLILDYGELLTVRLRKKLGIKFPMPTNSGVIIWLEQLCHMNGIDTVRLFRNWRKSSSRKLVEDVGTEIRRRKKQRQG